MTLTTFPSTTLDKTSFTDHFVVKHLSASNYCSFHLRILLDQAFRPALKKYIQPDVVTRRQWRASFSSGSGSVDPLDFPLDQVIITHTGSPPCGSKDECTYAIRGLQKFFMALGYHDIPYK